MFGFRPEPIAIPVAQTSSSLELPLPPTDAADGIAGVPAADAAAARSADAAAAGSSLEPIERLWGGGFSEIQHADLQVLHNIGHGSSGVVQKVLHVPSDSVLALKVIPVEADGFAIREV